MGSPATAGLGSQHSPGPAPGLLFALSAFCPTVSFWALIERYGINALRHTRMAHPRRGEPYDLVCFASGKQHDVVVVCACEQIEVGHSDELKRLARAAVRRIRCDGVAVCRSDLAQLCSRAEAVES